MCNNTETSLPTDTPTPTPSATSPPTETPTHTPTPTDTPTYTPIPTEPLTVNVTVSDPRCAGKKVKVRITLGVSGGQRPYTYSPARNFTLMSPIKQLKCQWRSTLQMVNTGLTLSSCLHTPVSSDRANRESGNVRLLYLRFDRSSRTHSSGMARQSTGLLA